MDQLPNHKVPRIGSAGERYRDLQLMRQLPRQDLSHEHCRMIHSDIEKKEYNIFANLVIKHLKNNILLLYKKHLCTKMMPN